MINSAVEQHIVLSYVVRTRQDLTTSAHLHDAPLQGEPSIEVVVPKVGV